MFLVAFRNCKRPGIDASAYSRDAERMEALAREQPGYLSFKSYASDDGEVIALSEWESEQAARDWGRNREHLAIQARGRAEYYDSYTLFACADPRVSRFERSEP
jgi:heme-degrading monooxygenase HmoA